MKKGMEAPKTKWQLRLLRLFYQGEYLEEIEGDLLERFERRVSEKKPAKTLLWLDVITMLRPELLKHFNTQTKKPTHMLAHNIKVSLRSFNKKRELAKKGR